MRGNCGLFGYIQHYAMVQVYNNKAKHLKNLIKRQRFILSLFLNDNTYNTVGQTQP